MTIVRPLSHQLSLSPGLYCCITAGLYCGNNCSWQNATAATAVTVFEVSGTGLSIHEPPARAIPLFVLSQQCALPKIPMPPYRENRLKMKLSKGRVALSRRHRIRGSDGSTRTRGQRPRIEVDCQLTHVRCRKPVTCVPSTVPYLSGSLVQR